MEAEQGPRGVAPGSDSSAIEEERRSKTRHRRRQERHDRRQERHDRRENRSREERRDRPQEVDVAKEVSKQNSLTASMLEDWTGKWITRMDLEVRYETQYKLRPVTGKCLVHFFAHYPWIVYLAYSMWRKTVMRRNDHADGEEDLSSISRLAFPERFYYHGVRVGFHTQFTFDKLWVALACLLRINDLDLFWIIVDNFDIDCQTLLNYVVGTGSAALTKRIIERKGDCPPLDLADTGQTGYSLLHVAAVLPSSSVDLVRLLLGKGVAVNARNNLGETPLLVSVTSALYWKDRRFAETDLQRQALCQILVGAGADISATDVVGGTALQYLVTCPDARSLPLTLRFVVEECAKLGTLDAVFAEIPPERFPDPSSD